MVKGCAAFPAGSPEGLGDGSGFLKDLEVCEPQDLDSLSLKGRGASHVVRASSRGVVPVAIDLDRET